MLNFHVPKRITLETQPDLLSDSPSRRATALLGIREPLEFETLLWVAAPKQPRVEIGVYHVIFIFYGEFSPVKLIVEVFEHRLRISLKRDHYYDRGSITLSFLLSEIKKKDSGALDQLSHIIVRPPEFWLNKTEATFIRSPFSLSLNQEKVTDGEALSLKPSDLQQMVDGCHYVMFNDVMNFEVIVRIPQFPLTDLSAGNFLPASQQVSSGRTSFPKYTLHDALSSDEIYAEIYQSRPILGGQYTPEELERDVIISSNVGGGTPDDWTRVFTQISQGSRVETLRIFSIRHQEDFEIGLGLDPVTKLAREVPDAPAQFFDELWKIVRETQASGSTSMCEDIVGRGESQDGSLSLHDSHQFDVP